MYRQYAIKLWNMASPDRSIGGIQHPSSLLLLPSSQFTRKHDKLKLGRRILHKRAILASFRRSLYLGVCTTF